MHSIKVKITEIPQKPHSLPLVSLALKLVVGIQQSSKTPLVTMRLKLPPGVPPALVCKQEAGQLLTVTTSYKEYEYIYIYANPLLTSLSFLIPKASLHPFFPLSCHQCFRKSEVGDGSQLQ